MPKNRLIILSIFFVLSLFFIWSRLQNLTTLPVFADEAIYVRWSQIIKNVETLRFIPLSDGKQPLYMWLVVPFLKLFEDPLFAGRFVTSMSGLILAFGLVILFSIITYSQTKPKLLSNPLVFCFDSFFAGFPANLIPFLIYLFSPFSFFYDRLATADTLLSAFGVWILCFTLLLSLFPRFDLSLLLGFLLGAAWVTKSPAIYFFILAFISFVFFRVFHQNFKFKDLIYISISLFLGFFIYNLLRLGPQFHQIALRNQDYVWKISDILKHPLDPLKPHLSDTITIYQYYLGSPLILLSVIGLLFNIFNRTKTNRTITVSLIILSTWWLLPLLSNTALAKVYTTRYILFTLPPLILLFSLAISALIGRFKIFIPVLLIVFVLNFSKLFYMSTAPLNLTLPSVDSGYIQGWTSGVGIKESAQYLKERSNHANIIVGSEGYFGTLPDGLQIYTDGTPRLTIVGVGIDITAIPSNLVNAKNYGDEVYLLFNQSRLKLPPHELQKLTIIKSIPKPDNDSLLLIKI